MKKYVAEMIGTMVLVLMGCGSAVIAGAEIGFLGIAFAFGLSVVAMAYAIGGISGCHINPAITLMTGRIGFVFQLPHNPVVQRTVIFKFQRTDGMGNALDGILDGMCKIGRAHV